MVQIRIRVRVRLETGSEMEKRGGNRWLYYGTRCVARHNMTQKEKQEKQRIKKSYVRLRNRKGKGRSDKTRQDRMDVLTWMYLEHSWLMSQVGVCWSSRGSWRTRKRPSYSKIPLHHNNNDCDND